MKISTINHSCDLNTLWDSIDFVAKKIELRAVKTIEVGEEVSSSYLYPNTAILAERKEKQLKLESWNFQCECDSCLQPETDEIKKFRDEWNEIKLKQEETDEKMKKLNQKEKFVQVQNVHSGCRLPII